MTKLADLGKPRCSLVKVTLALQIHGALIREVVKHWRVRGCVCKDY